MAALRSPTGCDCDRKQTLKSLRPYLIEETYEVIDAIPHNGSLMTKNNVLVSFNSDDDELARRLNTEAAKAIQYGDLDPNEALKLVTINPAKQLKICLLYTSPSPRDS